MKILTDVGNLLCFIVGIINLISSMVSHSNEKDQEAIYYLLMAILFILLVKI